MKKAYYAHCKAIYDTKQEKDDVKRIREMGFRVVNPNSDAYKARIADMKYNGCCGKEIMDYFLKVASQCDVMVFRALPDGEIPAGVHKEVQLFIDSKKPVVELPFLKKRKVLSIIQTANYTREYRK